MYKPTTSEIILSKSVKIPSPIIDQITEDMFKSLNSMDEFDADLLDKFTRLIRLGYLSSEEHLTKFMKTGIDFTNEDSTT